MQNCPKCNAKVDYINSIGCVYFTCGSSYINDQQQYQSKDCMLAECKQEIERLRKPVNLEAEALAQKYRTDYDLTYRCSVCLEGTINNILLYGLSYIQIKNILEDILDSIEFCEDES